MRYCEHAERLLAEERVDMQQLTSNQLPPRIDVAVRQEPPPPKMTAWSDAVVALGWPLAVTLIVILLRDAIVSALQTLSARAEKFSIGVVAFELASASARPWAGAGLADITANTAAVADSSVALSQALNDPVPADYAIIDLGNGREWLTSRLFIVVTLVQQLRGLRSLVFVVNEGVGNRLLGIASVAAVRNRLCRESPWLELALAQAWPTPQGNPDPKTLHPIPGRSVVDGYYAERVFADYKKRIQSDSLPAADGWTEINAKLWERGSWIEAGNLERYTGPLQREAVQRTLTSTREQFVRQVLKADGDLVPVVDNRNLLDSVIDRGKSVQRVLEQIADSV